MGRILWVLCTRRRVREHTSLLYVTQHNIPMDTDMPLLWGGLLWSCIRLLILLAPVCPMNSEERCESARKELEGQSKIYIQTRLVVIRNSAQRCSLTTEHARARQMSAKCNPATSRRTRARLCHMAQTQKWRSQMTDIIVLTIDRG